MREFEQGVASGAAITIGLAVICWVVAKVARRPLRAGLNEFGAFGIWASLYSGLAASEGSGRRTEAIRHAKAVGWLDGGGWTEHQAVSLLMAAPRSVQALAFDWYELHVLIIPAVGIGLLIYGRAWQYRRYKWGLLITGLPALAIFWAYPVASPATAYGLPGGLPANETGVALPYAALPSLHVCWALIVCWSLWHSRWKLPACCYALGTTLIVVLTGNHFVIDTAAGAVLAASAICVLRGLIGPNTAAQVAAPRPGAAVPLPARPAPVPAS